MKRHKQFSFLVEEELQSYKRNKLPKSRGGRKKWSKRLRSKMKRDTPRIIQEELDLRDPSPYKGYACGYCDRFLYKSCPFFGEVVASTQAVKELDCMDFWN